MEAPGIRPERGENAASEVRLAAARFAVDDPGYLVELPGAFAADVQFVVERLEAATQLLVTAGEEALNEARVGGRFGLE